MESKLFFSLNIFEYLLEYWSFFIITIMNLKYYCISFIQMLSDSSETKGIWSGIIRNCDEIKIKYREVGGSLRRILAFTDSKRSSARSVITLKALYTPNPGVTVIALDTSQKENSMVIKY